MKKTVTILTGATSGIGYETAKKLCLANHHLILGNRNNEKAKQLKEELLQLNRDAIIDLIHIDLSSLSSIKLFANEVINKYDRIDILINNAGVFMRELAYTTEKFEMTIGVNHLGTYYLTELLLDKLQMAKNPKIIMLSSIGCYFSNLKVRQDLFTRRTNSFKDYFNSKLANLLYAIDLKERLDGTNLKVKAADPGIAYSKIWKWRTKFGKSLDSIYKKITSSSEEGSRIVFQLANSSIFDENQAIIYKHDKPRKLPKKARNKQLRKELMNFTKEAIKNHLQ